jgi:hemin uptake protein HemP
MSDQKRREPARIPPSDLTAVAINSGDLFKGARELLIRHGQEIYRLRRTQAGKLILTK